MQRSVHCWTCIHAMQRACAVRTVWSSAYAVPALLHGYSLLYPIFPPSYTAVLPFVPPLPALQHAELSPPRDKAVLQWLDSPV